MLGWLYRVLIGSFKSCNHVFTIYKETKIYRADDSYKADEYILKCDKCGELTRRKFSL